jgi:hypothetical protein
MHRLAATSRPPLLPLLLINHFRDFQGVNVNLLLGFLLFGDFFGFVRPVNALQLEALGARDGELWRDEGGGGLAFDPQPHQRWIKHTIKIITHEGEYF